MSLLMGVEMVEFVYVKEQTGATASNLSVQLDKLSNAQYIQVEKGYQDKKPLTTCKVTATGIKAFEAYAESLKSDLNTCLMSH